MARRDVVLTAVVSVVVLGVTTLAAGHQSGVRPLDLVGYAWLLGGVLPLLWRKRFPLVVFVVSAAFVWSNYWSGYPGGPAVVAPTIALFTLARLSGPLVAGVAGAVALLVVAGVDYTQGGRLLLDFRPVGFVAWVVAVIGIGAAARSRFAAARAWRERQEEHGRRVAEQERLRIAREVHDVVAHSLAMINVQAGVGAHVADRRPDQAKEALVAIKEASGAALRDLRATLDVLRSGEDPAPPPSLRRLSGLADAVTAAGLRLSVEGDPGELPAPVDGAAYRIVQESITNAVRHAGGATAISVRLARSAGSVVLDVADDGAAPPAAAEGNGLRGMRERAEALGGTLTAGPGPGRGFLVHAELPAGDPR